MPEDINNKPLTIKDVHEVLIPAMEKVFATKKELQKFATKQDLEALEQRITKTFAIKQDLQLFVTKQDLDNLEYRIKGEMTEKFDKVLTRSDEILKNLDTLMTEKTVGDYQKRKERKLWKIMIEAMKEHKILSSQQVEQIAALEVF